MRRHKAFIAIAIILTVLLIPGNTLLAAENSSPTIKMDGSGTQDDPYQIADVSDINNLRTVIASGNTLSNVYFSLIADIDFNEELMKPLADWEHGRTFAGIFNGNGHTLSNFSIKSSETASFFGKSDGVIENLELCGLIEGNVVASFANSGSGTIINCISGCNLIAKENAAGIINYCNGSIQNTIFQGTINLSDSAGIVNGGNGVVHNVFSSNYPLGNASQIINDWDIDNTDSQTIVRCFNTASQTLFLNSAPNAGDLLQFTNNDKKFCFTNLPASFAGTGTEDNPYVIDTAEQLDFLRSLIYEHGIDFYGVYFYQTSDIDCSSVMPDIAADASVYFRGIYDGNGHTIQHAPSDGLFPYFDGTILNLILLNSDSTDGSVFFHHVGENALVLNSILHHPVEENMILDRMIEKNQIINCYFAGVIEPSVKQLNDGLSQLVTYYGIHCGELYEWVDENGSYCFGKNYKNTYLEKDRLYFKGAGVENNPYLVSSITDLVYVRESIYYGDTYWKYQLQQTADIDFSNVRNWRALAEGTYSRLFKGNYDGNGYKLLNFHQSPMVLPVHNSIFGYVYGSISNVYMACSSMDGTDNGLLAYSIQPTAKVFNNIIEVSSVLNPLVTSNAAIAYNNAGAICNNIVLRSNNLYDIKLIFSDNDETGINKYNQIISAIDTTSVTSFNKNIVKSALLLKRKITNFNTLAMIGDVPSLSNGIPWKSSYGIAFVKAVMFNNPIALLGVLGSICVLLYLIFYVCLMYGIKHKKLPQRICVQIITVIGIWFAFVMAMHTLKPDVMTSASVMALDISLALIGVACSLILIRKKRNIIKDFWIHFSFGNSLPLLISFLPVIIVHFACFHTPTAYDAEVYYGSFELAIQNFHFTIAGLLESFIITGKVMHQTAMIMTIGEAFAPGTAYGIYVINLILLLLAQLCVYLICRKLFPKLHTICCAMLSLCYALYPYVLSGSSHINADFYFLIGFTIFCCCVLYEYHLFAIFWGFVFICAKPNAIVSYVVFIAILAFCEWYQTSLHFRISKWIPYTLPATLYVALYYSIGSLTDNGLGYTTRGIEPQYYLSSRLLQYFAYGFAWIPEIIILSTFLYLLFKRKLSFVLTPIHAFLFAIWGSCFAQFIILILGGPVFALFPRYMVLCSIKNVVLLGAIFEKTKPEIHKSWMVGLWALLLFIQLFTTIDPTITLTAEKRKDDLYWLFYPQDKSVLTNDMTFYNYQYSYVPRIGSQILARLDKNEIMQLCSSDRMQRDMVIGGIGAYALYWDTNRNCRTYIPNSNCVRLSIRHSIHGMTTRERYELGSYTIILRESDDNAIRKTLDDREQMTIDGFRVFFSNDKQTHIKEKP